MTIAAALIYWVIVAVWLTVFATIVFFYVRNPHAFGTTRLLLAVLAIDTFRNIFENVYFGLYFGSTLGFLPATLAALMGQPVLLIVPKLLNVVAGTVVLALLLWRWLPLAVKERGHAEQRATDLETLATIDFLTGLYNRGHFEAVARAELARCQRYVRPLALLMIDIDHFKAVNDRYGHAVGDRVLRGMADVCRAAKRDSDVAGRIGGEEFAVLLPETTEMAAREFAERLRDLLRDCPLVLEGEKVAVTISIGIAGANVRTAGVEPLMRIADEALYEAKRTGRNKIVVARPLGSSPTREAAE
jgi:diguanylate cyclase (GGDEF)-like protein